MNGSDSGSWCKEVFVFRTERPANSAKDVAFIRINLGIYFSSAKVKLKNVELQEISEGNARDKK
jgi:hypothetical protein